MKHLEWMGDLASLDDGFAQFADDPENGYAYMCGWDREGGYWIFNVLDLEYGEPVCEYTIEYGHEDDMGLEEWGEDMVGLFLALEDIAAETGYALDLAMGVYRECIESGEPMVRAYEYTAGCMMEHDL